MQVTPHLYACKFVLKLAIIIYIMVLIAFFIRPHALQIVV